MARSNAKEISKKLMSKYSPFIAIALFAAAFLVTNMIMSSASNVDLDNYEFAKTIREIIDSEPGEVVLTINDNEYYDRELRLMIEKFKATDNFYARMEEDKLRSIVAQYFMQEMLILNEFDRFGLIVTQEELEEKISQEKAIMHGMLSGGGENAENTAKYLEGYGCTFTEYWEDEYTINSIIDSIKYEKVQKKICEDKGYENIYDTVVNTYLISIMKDDIYKITLFGEEYKYN